MIDGGSARSMACSSSSRASEKRSCRMRWVAIEPRKGQRVVDPAVVEEQIDERGDAVDLEVERAEP